MVYFSSSVRITRYFCWIYRWLKKTVHVNVSYKHLTFQSLAANISKALVIITSVKAPICYTNISVPILMLPSRYCYLYVFPIFRWCQSEVTSTHGSVSHHKLNKQVKFISFSFNVYRTRCMFVTIMLIIVVCHHTGRGIPFPVCRSYQYTSYW